MSRKYIVFFDEKIKKEVLSLRIIWNVKTKSGFEWLCW